MKPHFILTLAASALCGMSLLAGTYRDPQQRFQVDTPDRWTAEPFGEGVKLASGAAYCLFIEGQAASPEALLSQLEGQFAGQWSGMQLLKHAQTEVAGRPAQFRFHSGTNPKGIPSFLKVMAVDVNGKLLAIIESAPQDGFPTAKAGFDRIERSLQLGFGQGVPPRQPGMSPASGSAFLGLAIDRQQPGPGAMIGALAPGGPGQRAGLRPGDRIVALNGKAIQDHSSMPAAVSTLSPGDLVEIVVLRDGKQNRVTLQAAARGR